MNAPVALFIYNRPEHTLLVVEALKKNILAAETELFVFADGPKPGATDDELAKITKARSVVSSLEGFRNITLSFVENNKGLAASLIQGINKVLEKYDQIIVLEDDILTSKYFLSFCNEALQEYRDEKKVMAISGYSYPIEMKNNQGYFLRTGACWGWATWRRGWNQFSSDANALLHEIKSKNLISRFDFDGTANYYEMLKQQGVGKIDSWAVCWYATIFLKEGLVLFPPHSLTINAGMDGSGTHFKNDLKMASVDKRFFDRNREWILPSTNEPSPEMHNKLKSYFKKVNTSSFKSKIKELLKKKFFYKFR